MDTIPQIWMGTRGLQGEECYRTIRMGLELWYQMIDTAEHYQNEKDIGHALKDSWIPRGNIWITTKIRKESFGNISFACEKSLSNLKTNYLDLLLIHRPTGNLDEHHQIFEQLLFLKKQGKVKKIWVSNFTISQIQDLISVFWEEVFANEIEFHPCLSQAKMFHFSEEHHFHIIAYSPFGHGHLFQLPELQSLAQKSWYSLSQICLSRLLHQGVIVIPKASSQKNLQENLQSLQCSLSEDILQEIELLPKNYRYLNPPFAPQWD